MFFISGASIILSQFFLSFFLFFLYNHLLNLTSKLKSVKIKSNKKLKKKNYF